MEFKDYYQTLGVPRTADEAAIKKAFRKLAREYHPDVAKDKASAEEKFKEINEAFEVLGDPEKRAKYDQLGADWQRGPQAQAQGASDPWQQYTRRGGAPGADGGGGAYQEFHFGGTGFSDFFEQFFGGGARQHYGFPMGGEEFEQPERRSGVPMQGQDIEGDILVTLEEAMNGTQRPLTLQTVDPATRQTHNEEFTVRIPPGASDGRRIRVPGKGGPGRNGGPAGDLFLRIRLASHPEFRVKESDLFHDLELAPWEAVLGTEVLGTEVLVPTLDGARLKVKIPPGTQNGQQLRLRGRGLPKGRSGEKGDCYVVAQVQIPSAPGAEELELWKQLAATSTFQPRQNP